MATMILHHATLEEAAEYFNSEPIHCRTCRAEHDEEDGDNFRKIGEDAFCTDRDCYTQAALAAYRPDAIAALLAKLDEAEEELAGIEREYRIEDEAEDAPMALLIDLRDRLKGYAA